MNGMGKNIAVLLMIGIGGLGLFYYQKIARVEEIKRDTIAQSIKRMNASHGAFDKLSSNFYNEYNDYISKILHEVSMSGNDKRAVRNLRNELLDGLYPIFRSASLYGLIQFQIHDMHGRSFLRFNHHEVYGDDLKKIRPSIRRIVHEKRMIKGFEAGRFVEGLRYIYPLFYDGKYVGSFEWVWGHEALIRELRRIYGGWYAILVEKNKLQRTMNREEIRHFYSESSGCKGYLYQNNVFSISGNHTGQVLHDIFLHHNPCKYRRQKKDFVLEYKQNGNFALASFNLLKTFSGESYGYFIMVRQNDKIRSTVSFFYAEILFLFIIVVLIYLMLYRAHKEKVFVRTLIDSQKDIVILTNGTRLKDANKTFLDFFHVESIDEFCRQYGCICNLFIETGKFADPVRIKGKNWIRFLQNKGSEEQVVVMFDRGRGEERIFSVSINQMDETDLYVISFKDITELEKEKRYFKIEAMMDHLTQIYNKRAFEHYLEDKIDEMRFYGRKDIAIIMFDIDHFKLVNDRYGHQKGDRILYALAKVVKGAIRKSDFFARWGGEEFMIVLEGVSLEEAVETAEAIRKKIEGHFFDISQKLTCSFGVTLLSQNETAEEALERVDRLLYKAKKSGRNRVESEKSDQK